MLRLTTAISAAASVAAPEALANSAAAAASKIAGPTSRRPRLRPVGALGSGSKLMQRIWAFDVARLLSGDGNDAQSKIILISTHAEGDFTDLIDASPAVGFLPKAKLSAEAIREVLRAVED